VGVFKIKKDNARAAVPGCSMQEHGCENVRGHSELANSGPFFDLKKLVKKIVQTKNKHSRVAELARLGNVIKQCLCPARRSLQDGEYIVPRQLLPQHST
jgi:hypothetical protein